MRKCIALVLTCCILMSVCGGALAAYDGLQDKMFRQYLLSGIRGTAKLTATGGAAWAKELELFSDAFVEFRMLVTEDNQAELRSYINKNGTQGAADTWLWGNGKDLYLRSDMLTDTKLRFPWRGDFYSSLTSLRTQNPSFIQAVARMLLHGQDQSELMRPLREDLENFLMPLAQQPVRQEIDGETLLVVRYEIPEISLKDEMKALLRLALNDKEADGIYRYMFNLYLTEEQRDAAFSENRLAYEDALIESIDLGGRPLIIERQLTSMGELRRTSVTLPLARPVQGWTELTWSQENATDTYQFTGENPMTLSVRKTPSGYDGKLALGAAEGLRISADYALDVTFSELTDQENVSHEITTWTFRATAGEDGIPFDPILLSGSFHL